MVLTTILNSRDECRNYIILVSIYLNLAIIITIIVLQFTKNPGNKVEECKLRVVYLPPIPSTSSIVQGAEEVFSPEGSGG
ncbi:putative vesicle-associated membrane-protein-associated protein [Helianthus debilis subsp. tardiflorus]